MPTDSATSTMFSWFQTDMVTNVSGARPRVTAGCCWSAQKVALSQPTEPWWRCCAGAGVGMLGLIFELISSRVDRMSVVVVGRIRRPRTGIEWCCACCCCCCCCTSCQARSSIVNGTCLRHQFTLHSQFLPFSYHLSLPYQTSLLDLDYVLDFHVKVPLH